MDGVSDWRQSPEFVLTRSLLGARDVAVLFSEYGYQQVSDHCSRLQVVLRSFGLTVQDIDSIIAIYVISQMSPDAGLLGDLPAELVEDAEALAWNKPSSRSWSVRDYEVNFHLSLEEFADKSIRSLMCKLALAVITISDEYRLVKEYNAIPKEYLSYVPLVRVMRGRLQQIASAYGASVASSVAAEFDILKRNQTQQIDLIFGE